METNCKVSYITDECRALVEARTASYRRARFFGILVGLPTGIAFSVVLHWLGI